MAPGEADPGREALAVTEDGDDRGDRDDGGRQDLGADQRVEERRLAALELADADDVETSFGDPPGQRFGVRGERLRPDLAREPRQPPEDVRWSHRRFAFHHWAPLSSCLSTQKNLYRYAGRGHQPHVVMRRFAANLIAVGVVGAWFDYPPGPSMVNHVVGTLVVID